jgi:hypothetical protein
MSGVLGLLVAVVRPVAAHHSFAAGYEADKRVTVTGSVTRFDYMSPHSLLHIDVKGADGAKQSWMLEFGSPLVLSKVGWTATTFKFGDVIQAVGAPSRTGALRMYVFELKRPTDGFAYKASQGSQATPP